MSDFWGCLKRPKQNPIENMLIMMYKHLSGVQKQTTNIGVLLELGKVPLHINATKFAIKNWERIQTGHSNEILQSSYDEAESENLNWISSIRECLFLITPKIILRSYTSKSSSLSGINFTKMHLRRLEGRIAS